MTCTDSTDLSVTPLPAVLVKYLSKWHIPYWPDSNCDTVTLDDVPKFPIPSGILLPDEVLSSLSRLGFRCPVDSSLPEPIILITRALNTHLANFAAPLGGKQEPFSTDDFFIQIIEPNGAYRVERPAQNLIVTSIPYHGNEENWVAKVGLMNPGWSIGLGVKKLHKLAL